MEQVNTISLISANIDVIGRSFTAATYGALSSELAPILSALFVLYIIFWGFRFWQGRGNASIVTMAFRLIRVAIIFAIVSGWGSLQTSIYQGLTQAPVALSSIMLDNIRTEGRGGMSERTIERDLSDFYRVALITSVRVFEQRPRVVTVADPNQPPPEPRPSEARDDPLSFDLRSPVAGAMIWGTSVLFVGFAVFLIAFSKIALLVILALAPVFIIMLLFNGPSRFFSGWLTVTLQVMLVPVLLYAFLGFYLLTIREPLLSLMQVLDREPLLAMKDVAPFVLICVVGLLLMSQVIPLAGRIASHTSQWAVEKVAAGAGGWGQQIASRVTGSGSGTGRATHVSQSGTAQPQSGMMIAPVENDQTRMASVKRLSKNR